MAQEHIVELREILGRELDEDTKAEMESSGLSLDKDEDIEKIGGAMAIFDAHEKGEELSEEQLEFVSGGSIFKKIWHKVKHAVTSPGFYKGALRGVEKGIEEGLEGLGEG